MANIIRVNVDGCERTHTYKQPFMPALLSRRPLRWQKLCVCAVYLCEFICPAYLCEFVCPQVPRVGGGTAATHLTVNLAVYVEAAHILLYYTKRWTTAVIHPHTRPKATWFAFNLLCNYLNFMCTRTHTNKNTHTCMHANIYSFVFPLAHTSNCFYFYFHFYFCFYFCLHFHFHSNFAFVLLPLLLLLLVL